jgi:hypothetical protein
MTADVVKLPTPDPIFALAPELNLHLSEIDGALVVNSREVARVFFDDNHRQLLRHIMWLIWNDPMQPNYHDEFRQCPDGTVDITPHGLLSATSHWGFEYEHTERHKEFQHGWIGLVRARMQEVEAQTGINPLHQKMQELFGPMRCFKYVGSELRECCQDCAQPEPDGPMLHDELWASIASECDFLCFDCIEKRLGRSLTQADLTICPFNAGWISFDGADVVAMQFARGRHLLPVERESQEQPS